ncbi:MAG: hypothetical protein LBT59_23770, partial [Clostridiales bacterium]|nr:hypothetical protein [Clostridiales bacterium]
DICQALDLYSQRGVTHAYVKPSNIFRSKDGHFKLDIGFGKNTRFMSPEDFNNQERGLSADLYSLGLVLYTLLNNGRIPFLSPYQAELGGSYQDEAIARRMKGDSLLPPVFASQKLSAVILKACAYDPSNRFEKASDMREALEDCLPKANAESFSLPEQSDSSLAKAIAPSASPVKKKATGLVLGAFATSACMIAVIMLPAAKVPALAANTQMDSESLKIEDSDSYLDYAFINRTAYDLSTETLSLNGVVLKENDLSQISKLTKLRELSLVNTKISSLDFASNLTELASLDISHCNVANLEPLSRLNKLQSLNISHNRATSLEPLSNMANLEWLAVSFADISDLAPLANLESLTTLYLNGNKIRDLQPLSSLSNLSDLWLGSNLITSIDPLSGLANLSRLDLSLNQITDIRPISGSVKTLHLNDNKIEDAAPLSELTGLIYLDISRNRISLPSYLELDGTLANCRIDYFSLLELK